MAPRKNPDEGQPNHDDEGGVAAATLNVPEGWASVLFDKAFSLNEDYTTLVTQRRANREALRNLEAQGLLTDDEREMLNELYPARATKANGDTPDAPAPDEGTPAPDDEGAKT